MANDLFKDVEFGDLSINDVFETAPTAPEEGVTVGAVPVTEPVKDTVAPTDSQEGKPTFDIDINELMYGEGGTEIIEDAKVEKPDSVTETLTDELSAYTELAKSYHKDNGFTEEFDTKAFDERVKEKGILTRFAPEKR